MTHLDWFWMVAAFLFGSVFGSFLNVCIYRMPLGKSLIYPPSHCPKCFQPVGRWNIPIIGYFLVGGKCRQCGEAFSIQYPAVELLTALMLSAFYYVIEVVQGAPIAVYLAYALLGMMLIVATFVDLGWKIIPRRLTVFGTVAALVVSAVYPRLHANYLGAHPGGGAWVERVSRWVSQVVFLDGVMASVAGIIAGVLVILVVRFVGTKVFRREAMGLGDAKLMAVIGGFLGWKAIPIVFLAAAFVGAVVGILSYLKTREREIPLGPFLSVGAVIVMLCGNELVHWWVVDLMRLEPTTPMRIISYGFQSL